MKVGVYYPSQLPRSAVIYADQVMTGMKALGAEFLTISNEDDFSEPVDAFITVSTFAKREIVEILSLPEAKVVPIYHGVDHEVFLARTFQDAPQFLLHVSQYQPLKNINRVIEAYSRIRMANKPSLVLIVPGYKEVHPVAGVEIIDKFLNASDRITATNKSHSSLSRRKLIVLSSM